MIIIWKLKLLMPNAEGMNVSYDDLERYSDLLLEGDHFLQVQ